MSITRAAWTSGEDDALSVAHNLTGRGRLMRGYRASRPGGRLRRAVGESG